MTRDDIDEMYNRIPVIKKKKRVFKNSKDKRYNLIVCNHYVIKNVPWPMIVQKKKEFKHVEHLCKVEVCLV